MNSKKVYTQKKHYIIWLGAFYAMGGVITRKEVIINESVKPTTNVYSVRSS